MVDTEGLDKLAGSNKPLEGSDLRSNRRPFRDNKQKDVLILERPFCLV